MTGQSDLVIELLACGDEQHRADLVTLRERGLAVPHHYSSWGTHLRSVWCRASSSGVLVTGFAIEVAPSRMVPGTRIGRIDRLGRALHAEALPHLGSMLRTVADRLPRLLRLDVRVFDEDATRRQRICLELLRAGAVPGNPERDYSHTLLLPVANLAETFADGLSRRMRLEVTRFLDHPGTRIAPIADACYSGRVRELLRDSFTRTGGHAPRLDVKAMMDDARGSGESLLLGAFSNEYQAPNDLVAFAWGRAHGDHVVYDAAGSARARFLHHLSPGYALLWHLAQWGQGRGATWFDLGGINATGAATFNALSGVESFKRRFSDDERCVAAEYTLRPRSKLAGAVGAVRTIATSVGFAARSRDATWTGAPTTDSLQHRIIEDDAGFAGLQADWADLLARSCSNLLPLTHFWTAIWWKNFGAGARRQIHCFYRNSKLIAVAPMMLSTEPYRGFRLRQLTSMANGHTPHAGLLHDRSLDADAIAAITRQVADTSGASLTAFLRVPEADDLCMLMRNQSRFDGRPLGLRRSVATPLIRIASDWETFFATRSQKFRKNMRNKANKFAKASGCRIERRILTSPDDPTLDQMQEVSRHSWKGKAGTDLASVPEARAFLHDLIGALGPGGGVHVWMALAGSQPVAYEFHARYAGVTYPLRADFDERHRELSPGSVVEYTALKEIFEEGAMHLYDSCANDYWYLSNWTDEVRLHYDIELFARGFKPRLAHAAEYLWVPLLRRARELLRKTPSADAGQPAASH